jgi:hypothetical protein
MRNNLTTTQVLALSLGFLFVAGCGSGGSTGAGIGALAGAGIGQLAGGSTEATLIGAAIGGGAGYIVGNEADKKAANKRTSAEMASIRQEMNYVTVNVTNSNSSIIQVRLRKQGVGYVGTRGEYYDHLPTSEELRPVYGF